MGEQDTSNRQLLILTGCPLDKARAYIPNEELFIELARNGSIALFGHFVVDLSALDMPGEYSQIPNAYLFGATFDFDRCKISNSDWIGAPDWYTPDCAYLRVRFDYKQAEAIIERSLALSGYLPKKRPRGAPARYDWDQIVSLAEEVFRRKPKASQNEFLDAVAGLCETTLGISPPPSRTTLAFRLKGLFAHWRSQDPTGR